MAKGFRVERLKDQGNPPRPQVFCIRSSSVTVLVSGKPRRAA